jgi:hypothetical protein
MDDDLFETTTGTQGRSKTYITMAIQSKFNTRKDKVE